MRNRLQDKVAIVTGAAQGLGAAIAERFVDEGARVVATDVQFDAVRQTAARLGGRATALQLDVSSENSFRAALDGTLRDWSRLDILVNNAGVTTPSAPVHTTTNRDFQQLVDVNLRGAWLGCKLAYEPLKASQGCVLNISSMAGVSGQANHAVYAATKGAINALTKCTAVDWGPDRIRINALCPTGVWTEALRQWRLDQPNPDEVTQYLDRIHALGYCPEPEEIATVAAFLCSDEARFMTGAVVPVSGGSECGYKL
ncbi:MAG: glucose 1-dehydrogenase [Planctomycetota bacterium]